MGYIGDDTTQLHMDCNKSCGMQSATRSMKLMELVPCSKTKIDPIRFLEGMVQRYNHKDHKSYMNQWDLMGFVLAFHLRYSLSSWSGASSGWSNS